MWISRALLVQRVSVFSETSLYASHQHAIPRVFAHSPSSSSPTAHCLLQYRCVVYNKITKNKLLLTKTRDSAYENFMDDEKKMNLLKRIIKLLLKQPEKKMLYRYMLRRGGYVGLVKPQKMGHILDKYPRIIRVYRNPNELDVWVTLAKPILELLEEEKRLKEERVQQAAERLRQVLMMSATRRIRLDRINYLKEELGLPDNFKRTVIRSNPHLFKLVITKVNLEKGVSPSVKLLEWDEKLAVPVIEKYRQDPASTSGLDEEEKKKKAYSFPISLPPGFKIKKAFRHKLRKWQELPYRSPYADTADLDMKSEEALKRAVAVIHEFLHITVEKRTRVDRLAHLREDYKLPQKLGVTVLQNPGIFYMSTKSNTQTVFLREGYKKGELLNKDALFSIKEKFMALIRMGRKSTKTTKKGPHAICDSDTSDSDTSDEEEEEMEEGTEGAVISEERDIREMNEEEGSDYHGLGEEEEEEEGEEEEESGEDDYMLSDQNEAGQESAFSNNDDESCPSESCNEVEEGPCPASKIDEDNSASCRDGSDADKDENEMVYNDDVSDKNVDDKLIKDPFQTEDDDTEGCSVQDICWNKCHQHKGGYNYAKHSLGHVRKASHGNDFRRRRRH